MPLLEAEVQKRFYLPMLFHASRTGKAFPLVDSVSAVRAKRLWICISWCGERLVWILGQRVNFTYCCNLEWRDIFVIFYFVRSCKFLLAIQFRILDHVWGWRCGSAVKKGCSSSPQRTQVWMWAPTLGGSQLSVTLAPEDQAPSSVLHANPLTCGTHYIHLNVNKNPLDDFQTLRIPHLLSLR